MNRNSKKGFTIVELIIVIAVIAVLAAVLIPTFSNLIQKANEAKDTALVSNLNKGLKMSGKSFTTMHEALQAVEENVGVNVEKISAVATDSEILWDSVNNCFVYLKSGDTKPTYIPDSQKTPIGETELYKYWKIVDATDSTIKYSQYLAGDNHNEAVIVNTGFDAGKNANLVSVTYTNTDSQSVVIRTNGGELVVDAGNATVAHYGAANYVNIKNVYKDSFHEYGVAAVVRIEQGHFVAEATAKVINLNVASSEVKITETDGAKVVGYSKDNESVTVTVNGTAKDVTNVKTATDVEAEGKSSAVVAEGGVAEVDGIQVASLAAAFKMVKDKAAITMLKDTVIDETIIVSDAMEVSLNLNGHQVLTSGDVTYDGGRNPWAVQVLGKLFVSGNGTFGDINHDCVATLFLVQQNGLLDVNGSANYYGGLQCVLASGNSMTKIHGGSWYGGTYNGFYWTLNKMDSDKSTVTIEIDGGIFDQFDPSNAKTENPAENWVKDGYKVVDIGNSKYNVVKAN